MTLTEAYRVLGVSPGASAQEIKRRRKALEKFAHPDAGGSRAQWDLVQEAAMVTMQSREKPESRELDRPPSREVDRPPSKTLAVPPSRSLDIPRQDLDAFLARERTAEVRATVTRRQTSPLKRARRRSWAFASLTGAGTAVLGLYRAVTPSATLLDPILLVLGVLVAICALIGFSYKYRTERLENSIEDFTDELGNPRVYLHVIEGIAAASSAQGASNLDLREPWSADELEASLTGWSRPTMFGPRSPRELAAHIGATDATRLLLVKGVELGLLRELPRSDKREATRYVLDV